MAELTVQTTMLSATVGEIAALVDGEVVGRVDLAISRVAPLNEADPESLSFIRSQKYAAQWTDSDAAAALVTRGIEVPGHDPKTRALILVDNADLALVALLAHAKRMMAPPREPGIHPSAVVHESATIAPTATIGPGCVIDARATVGERTHLVARVYLGINARIGDDTMIQPGVTILDRCVVGDRCQLHPGVSIGGDGFGFVPCGSSNHDQPRHIKVPHIGTVIIADDVEIGANSCIDRGKLDATRIGAGTKIDNLVQIAHNCCIGRDCIICGQAGLAGSATLGDRVTLGGGAKISDNTIVGDDAIIIGNAGVTQTVPPGETWMGFPAGPFPEAAANASAARRLAATTREVHRLRKQVDRLMQSRALEQD